MLVSNKLVGSHIKDYYEHRIVSRQTKIRAISLLWLSILISSILIKKWIIIVSLFIIASLVSYHLSKLKSEK